jgi:hypothetical protein
MNLTIDPSEQNAAVIDRDACLAVWSAKESV